MNDFQGHFGKDNQEENIQGKYGEHQQEKYSTSQNRYGKTEDTWTCPACETHNTGDVCILCGYTKTTKKRKKFDWKIIAASVVMILVFVTSFWIISAFDLDDARITVPNKIKNSTEIVGENAFLVFHQDKTDCVVRIDVYPRNVYTKGKAELEGYYTLEYEENKVVEICRFSSKNDELSRHTFSYEDGRMHSQSIATQDNQRDYIMAVTHRDIYGYSIGGRVFEETNHCWDSLIFRVQNGVERHYFDVRICRNGSVEGYSIYVDQENKQFYSDKLQLMHTQLFQGTVDIEYNTDETFKPRYVFHDNSGKEILPEAFEVFGESHDYGLPCVSCAKISDKIIYISMFRDLELFGIAEKVSATVQFYYVDNSEPSERIRVDVGNRENNSILEMVVDMSHEENWSLENVQKIALHISGPRATMDNYITLNVAN